MNALLATLGALVLAASAPTAPQVAGARQTTPGMHTYVFSSKERGVAASKLRFRCGLDTPALHTCARSTRLKLTAGTHILRAQATDPQGRRSPVTRVTLVARQPVPELAATEAWKVDVSEGKDLRGQFSVAVGPDGTVYAVDAAGNRVAVYDAAGKLVRRWGTAGTGPGQFRFDLNSDSREPNLPFSSIAVDPRDGGVWVAESQRVQRFSAQGTYQRAVAAAGLANGQFTRIVDVAAGPTGTLYVLEDRPDRQGRVQLFDANGTFQAAFGRGDIIDSGGVEIDASGNALVSDDLANELMVFAPDGHVVRSFGEPGNGPGQLHFPTGLALAGSVLYVADSEHDRVVRFDLASGKPTGYWAAGKFPQGLAVDGAGAVYAITDSGLLSKYVLS